MTAAAPAGGPHSGTSPSADGPARRIVVGKPGIEGDPHRVVGISVPLLRELAADLGVRLTDLRERPTTG